MKTIKSLKDITTLEVGDVVVFGDLKYRVYKNAYNVKYYLLINGRPSNDEIFKILNLEKEAFIKKLGINAECNCDFPETKSLEALTAIVSALFKEWEKQNEFPKTWEEFCKRNPVKEGEYVIDIFSHILGAEEETPRNADEDRNFCTSKQEAGAHLALMQLRQLRKAYVKNWEPELGEKEYYGIVYTYNGIKVEEYQWNYRNLSFPTEELAKQFLTNFKDLLEIAKPLL